MTFLDMNEEELRDLVRKERKAKRRLMERLDQAERSPDWFEAEGNRGGSYVRLDVGETCVVTVRQDISVAALAAILTYCRDEGFQRIVDAYCAKGGGVPSIKVEHDGLPELANHGLRVTATADDTAAASREATAHPTEKE